MTDADEVPTKASMMVGVAVVVARPVLVVEGAAVDAAADLQDVVVQPEEH